VLLVWPCFAQKHEVGLTLGGITGSDRSGPQGDLHFGSGTALQANYGYRFVNRSKIALLGEVHFLANAQRQITSSVPAVTRDVATIFVTPGVRVKFAPNAMFSPYLVTGAGAAFFQQSLMTIGGSTNPASRNSYGGVLDFGCGADMTVRRWLAFRAEIRDFHSANPIFNIPTHGNQHNVVAGGGFVLKLGRGER
jgi:opacity protein-like surface antigen